MYHNYYYQRYLAHIGTESSGRYPRGSGKRPYQRTDRGIRGYIKKRRQTKQEAEAKKARTKALKDELQKRKEEEYKKQNKNRILKEGTATEVLKYQNEYTNAELISALERIRVRDQLQAYSEKDLKNAWTAMDNAKKKVDKVTGYGKTAIEAYKVGNEIIKMFDNTNKAKKTA